MKRFLKVVLVALSLIVALSTVQAFADDTETTVVVEETANADEALVVVEDAANADEVLVIEDEETPAAAPTAHMLSETVDKTYAGCTLAIYADWGNKVLEGGDMVTLSAVLNGYDGLIYTIRWQFNDGNGWQDIAGADGSSYRFVFGVDNWQYTWRVAVEITGVID